MVSFFALPTAVKKLDIFFEEFVFLASTSSVLLTISSILFSSSSTFLQGDATLLSIIFSPSSTSSTSLLGEPALLPASDQTAGVSALLANPESGLSFESPLVTLFLSSVDSFVGLGNSSSSTSSDSSFFFALLLGVKNPDIFDWDFADFSSGILAVLLGVKNPEIFICDFPSSFPLGVLALGVLTSFGVLGSLGVFSLRDLGSLGFLTSLGVLA